MFNFFRKKKFDRKIPKEYIHLINQKQYDTILNLALQYFKEKGDEVLKLENGLLTTKSEGDEEVRYGFDNLIRMMCPEPQEDWESILYRHFNTVNVSNDYLVYYKKDYEAAKPFLKVLIKDIAVLDDRLGGAVVSRVDFPGTCTVLVMDYDNQFRYLRKEDIAEWEATEEEIFSVALENIGQEEVTINKVDHEGAIEMFVFLSGDFSAAQMIDLGKNAGFAIGKYGSIVAIPTKGTAFATPIDDDNVVGRLEVLADPVYKFFTEDPGNITLSIYWFYAGEIKQFVEKPSNREGYVTIGIPEELQALINEN